MQPSPADSTISERLHTFIENLRVSESLTPSSHLSLVSQADTLVQLFNMESKAIIDSFPEDLRPKAIEFLNELLTQAGTLRQLLNEILAGSEKERKMSLIELSKAWARLGAKWTAPDRLKERVFEFIMDQTKNLIDRDLKIIKDYQKQSISPLSDDPEIIGNLENRLNLATQEVLQQFSDLTSKPSQLNFEAASTWIKNIHEQRQNFFDRILLKTDNVVKELEGGQIAHDPITVHELNSELTFMEHECDYFASEVKRGAVEISGLLSLNEDLIALEPRGIPFEMLSRFENLKNKVEYLIKIYQEQGRL